MRVEQKGKDFMSNKQKSSLSLKIIKEILKNGGPGYLQFAITNACNARCKFCNFAAGKIAKDSIKFVSLEDTFQVIEISKRMNIGYILFVGGEPLIHPNITTMIRYAARAGFKPMICTNGGLLSPEMAYELVDAGLSSVIISIDAPDVQAHETNRGLVGVCEKINQANKVFRKYQIQTTASVTISRLIIDYENLTDFVAKLGFDSITFSYPLTYVGSSYLSYSDSNLVMFSKEELIERFSRIQSLHYRSPIPIVNPIASLEDMKRHLRGEQERFECLAGYKYFYLDWNLDLYRCHYWEQPICKIWEFDESMLIRDGCTRCMIDCYRDPSVLQFIAISLSDAWQFIKKGNFLLAIKKIMDRRNLISLWANWQARKYIRRI